MPRRAGSSASLSWFEPPTIANPSANDFGANAARLETLRVRLGWEKLPVLRNRQRVLGAVESPFDNFGPSFFKQGDLALEDDRAGGTAAGAAINIDRDPLAAPWLPPPPRPENLRGWLKETNPRETR